MPVHWETKTATPLEYFSHTTKNVGCQRHTFSNLGHTARTSDPGVLLPLNHPQLTISGNGQGVETDPLPHCLINTDQTPLFGEIDSSETDLSLSFSLTQSPRRHRALADSRALLRGFRGASLKPTALHC